MESVSGYGLGLIVHFKQGGGECEWIRVRLRVGEQEIRQGFEVVVEIGVWVGF